MPSLGRSMFLRAKRCRASPNSSWLDTMRPEARESNRGPMVEAARPHRGKHQKTCSCARKDSDGTNGAARRGGCHDRLDGVRRMLLHYRVRIRPIGRKSDLLARNHSSFGPPRSFARASSISSVCSPSAGAGLSGGRENAEKSNGWRTYTSDLPAESATVSNNPRS